MEIKNNSLKDRMATAAAYSMGGGVAGFIGGMAIYEIAKGVGLVGGGLSSEVFFLVAGSAFGSAFIAISMERKRGGAGSLD